MKKILILSLMVAFAGSAYAATTTYTGTSSTRVENYVNSKLAPVAAKERDFNAKVEANKKANEAKKAEFEKKQQADKAALEKAKKDAEARQAERQKAIEQAKKNAQARQEQRQKAIQAEKDYINSFKKK